jgi:ABC-type sugar transport system ATPase subunit
MTTAEPLLEAHGLDKRFFENTVLAGVSIEIRPGRVHALLGENGAGKSTLINLISGVLEPDAGTIRIDGRDYQSLTPALARELGIAVVQQELSLAPHLSVAENIVMGAVPRRGAFIDYGKMADDAAALCSRLGLGVGLDTQVDRLSLGRRQLIEIAKALYRKPRLLILDEPTSSLTGHEVRILFALLAELKREGVAILYISHRLNEVLDLCDWVTVLKDGRRTADEALGGSDPKTLVRLMVGREPGDLFPAFDAHPIGGTAIATSGLVAEGVRGVDLDVRFGEVLGMGGLLGQGQEETLRALFGDLPVERGSIAIAGEERRRLSPMQAIERRAAYVPADRKKEALLLPLSIHFNLVLPSLRRLARRGLRRRNDERASATDAIRRFAIRVADPEQPTLFLSGGNQQKVAMARWLPLEPQILLLNDPTRGVDVETKREIYGRLRQLARQGVAILLLSSDTLELIHVCDRVAVFRDGRVVADLDRAALTEEAIVAASLGVEQETSGVAA